MYLKKKKKEEALKEEELFYSNNLFRMAPNTKIYVSPFYCILRLSVVTHTHIPAVKPSFLVAQTCYFAAFFVFSTFRAVYTQALMRVNILFMNIVHGDNFIPDSSKLKRHNELFYLQRIVVPICTSLPCESSP